MKLKPLPAPTPQGRAEQIRTGTRAPGQSAGERGAGEPKIRWWNVLEFNGFVK